MRNNPFHSKWEEDRNLQAMDTEDQKVFIAGVLFYRIKQMIGEEIPRQDLPMYFEGFSQWRRRYPNFQDVLDVINIQVMRSLGQSVAPPSCAIAFLTSVYEEVEQWVNG